MTKFAFVVHPLSRDMRAFIELESQSDMRALLSQGNVMELCRQVQNTLALGSAAGKQMADRVTILDDIGTLRSARGKTTEGRLYEIPLDAYQILENPHEALGYIDEAVRMAAEWGAGIVGLGSMTGVVGGHGTLVAKNSPIPVTTGNSLTVYAALQNLRHVCQETGIDLSGECVAVVGIPGSIATAAAKILASDVGELLLVARRDSERIRQTADKLGARFFTDISAALAHAKIVLSATSTGGCIDQFALQPGSIVVDIGVPADVYGRSAQRDDVLIISGGLTEVPLALGRDSILLQMHLGMVPSCLAETMNLAMESRSECFSLGRELNPDKVSEIGEIAVANGFVFERLLSFGQPVEESMWANFLKVVSTQRCALHRFQRMGESASSNGQPTDHQASASPAGSQKAVPVVVPPLAELAKKASVLYRRYVNPVFVDMAGQAGLAKVFVRGEGCYLWDSDGRKYLDFVAGFGSLNLGHNHPRVTSAINRALKESAPGFAQSAINPYAAALAEQLVAHAPQGLEMVFLCNSGTESVEAALKLARRTTDREGFLSCDGSFHGKSLGALSVTGNPEYQKPFRPLLPNCRQVPFGDLHALERRLTTRDFAAFVVEPLQGEGGMIVPPAGYLSKAQSLCRDTGTLFIVDEVQTGMGRTGTMFACQREGVEPDVMTLAKSLGGGLMPIGATLARRDLWRRAYGTLDKFMLHTTTFGGGSLACAAALATLQTLSDSDLMDNAVVRGKQLMDGLREIQKQTTGYIREVRGQGLMIGLELEPLTDSVVSIIKRLDTTGILEYLSEDMDDMVLALPAIFQMQNLFEKYGIYSQVARSNPLVLRVQPPLSIDASMVDHFLTSVSESCKSGKMAENIFDVMVTRSISGQLDSNKLRSTANVRKVDLRMPDDPLTPYDDVSSGQ